MRIIFLVVLTTICLNATAKSVSVNGLVEDVEILKDQWGVSHIYANTQRDLFFAQGYNAARDRLFQFELWRRRALGTLAEIQGQTAVDHDIGARLLRYRGDLTEELNHYHDDGADIVSAFVQGVNAYIDEVSDDPEALPEEFRVLGIKPGRWTTDVVVSRHNALTGGLSNEVLLAKTITALGSDMTSKVLPFERTPHLVPAEGIDLSLINDEVMHLYRASRRPAMDFGAQAQAQFVNPLDEINSHGSNNWVIAGSRTASGNTLMANDPHRRLELPSLRYIVHLNAPGWNVIGAGEPTLPGVSIGHNEFGAWGLTIFRIDQEDLFVYRTNPDNTNQYFYRGSWREMEIETTTVNVKGSETVSAQLKYTVHRPVIHEDPDHRVAYGLKAAWLEKGSAPYLASLRMDQATDWQSFREACYASGMPGENMVWADRKGDIGWQSVGFTPIRKGWQGRLPVPGNGQYDWHGFVPIEDMPYLHNPESGWYGTANHNNVPKDYPNIFSDFYSDPARSFRLNEVLGQARRHTIEDSKRLQYDNKSMTAEKIMPHILGVAMPDHYDAVLLKLRQWDFMMARDSVAALIYDRWEVSALASINETVLPGQQLVGKVKLLEWMQNPPAYIFGEHPRIGRDTLVRQTLISAIEELKTSYGTDMGAWQYGKGHYSHFTHPLQNLTEKNLNIGPLARGGASNTLNANRGDGRQVAGATFRIITDTADWDATLATNAPGQSGDPASPHYDSLFKDWNQGNYFPLYYSRPKIESVVSERLILKPLGSR